MEFYNEFDSVFFISLATLLVGSFGLTVKYCLRSKCEDISICFGLLKVHRNVNLETELEMKELEEGKLEQLENKI
jgi:hypothetical protein